MSQSRPQDARPSGRDIFDLSERLERFAQDRDWDKFHSVRNLIFAVVGEVGELAAEVQWVCDEQMDEYLNNTENKFAIASEMADILNYLVRLADKLDVDLVAEAMKKIDLNEGRYPAEKSRGSSAKYTAYE